MSKDLFINAKAPQTFGNLRTTILQKAKLQPDWGQELPLKWLPLEDAMSRLQKSNVKVLPTSGDESLERLNEALAVRLTPAELEIFLKHKHSLGHLLYFPESVLNEHLILDQGWLIDALKSLVFAERFAEDGPRKNVYSNLAQKGIVSDEVREDLWSQPEFAELKRFSKHTLMVMEKLDIITRPKSYRDEKAIEQPYYYVPCMVKEAPKGLNDALPDAKLNTFTFEEGFLPSAAFSRLLTSCLALWPVHKDRLFCERCVLNLDKSHTMLLERKENSIVCAIVHTRDPTCTSTRLVRHVWGFLEESLDRILATYGLPNITHKYYHSKHDIIEVIILYIFRL